MRLPCGQVFSQQSADTMYELALEEAVTLMDGFVINGSFVIQVDKIS
jgi:hypothetical protein